MNQEIKEKISLLDKYSLLAAKSGDALSLYERYKNNFEEKGDSEVIALDLFREIKNSAGNFNLDIKRIKPQTVEKKKEYKKICLEVELEGNFSSIFRFINHLENLTSFIRISSLELSSRGGSLRQLRCRVTFFKIFF